MFDRTSSQVPTAAALVHLPEPPQVADAVDRLDFGAVFHNQVALPDD